MTTQTEPTTKPTDETTKPTTADNLIVRQHSITLNGQTLNYTTTTGTIVLKEENDKKGHEPKAELFFIAYTKDDVDNIGKRPITFSFNGGPGSSSIWLHLGILGPRRVPLGDGLQNETAARPPFHLTDNEYTLLTETDLVFIDPIGTGYSRMIAGDDSNPHEYHTFQRDLESVGEFIRLYTSRYQRWASPKFLIGESYGTTRAAGLAEHLQTQYGLFLNGVMLISAILNFQTAVFHPGNDLPHILFLPSFAATAWYHQKIDEKYLLMPLETFLEEVTDFAETDYTLALMKGARLDDHERTHIIERLAAYTGLSWQYIEQTNLRPNIHKFVKQFLREDGLTVGRFDSRLKGRDRDDTAANHEYDPSYAIVQGIYAACLNQYVRAELGYESDLPYNIISFKVFPNWKYNKFQNAYVNTAEHLRQAISHNPHLKVFVGNGYYDLATPYFATEYTFDHLGLRGDLTENVQMAYYHAGHMMYIHQPDLIKLSQDLHHFIRQTLG